MVPAKDELNYKVKYSLLSSSGGRLEFWSLSLIGLKLGICV